MARSMYRPTSGAARPMGFTSRPVSPIAPIGGGMRPGPRPWSGKKFHAKERDPWSAVMSGKGKGCK